MEVLDKRKCSKCKKLLPISCFHKKSGEYPSEKYTYYCKECDKKRLSENKDKYNLIRKERRHKKGTSKNYNVRGPSANSLTPIEIQRRYREKNKDKVRLYRKKYKYNKKMAGELTIKTIQLIYEDNIKKFGTLTCYLCLKSIEMQKEHLEHKNPLSKGGSNNYENLGISCARCNRRKHDKTVNEYLDYLNKIRST